VLKAGITLDGRIADFEGISQWITGPEAREAGHHLRSSLGAVLVGSGTLMADNPSLNTRTEGGQDALPVVLDSNLRIPDDARVLTAGRRPVIFCAPDAPARGLPADIIRVPRSTVGLDLTAVLAALWERGVRGLLVEGGGQVHRSMLDADLVDRLELFIAPKILAGGAGFVGGSPWSLSMAPTFRVVAVSLVGDDVRISMERRNV
jgi:diaminohydroxyphosphoribosylaminopyrimidine deaminase/5-amino-6-(5-phosphoribosylamino)uracil reductase